MNFNSYSIGLILYVIFFYLGRQELSTLSTWSDLSMIDRGGGTDAEL